jgi:hypothetical protein
MFDATTSASDSGASWDQSSRAAFDGHSMIE